MTVKDAIEQISAQITMRGKFSLPVLLDSVIGVAQTNSADLQDMLNKLMTKKGVLSPADEAAVQALLDKAAADKKERQRVRLVNGLMIGGAVAGVGVLVYLMFKRKK